MIKIIISVLIALILYDLAKQGLKLIFVKKQKDNLKTIIERATKIYPFEYDKEFWEDK